MQQRKNNTGITAELQSIFSSQEKAGNFPGAASHRRTRDEDAELSSREALIQAVLNSNTEETDAGELLDWLLP
ncbi:MAG: hypothetical protein JOY62_05740 [Acidobacteriaceae bacterium]|nr:hypothetical protein [Acidobacteriaceae bacterium]MBV9779460.1 hypothetical protein [Acidobacteriaceae bacterium]